MALAKQIARNHPNYSGSRLRKLEQVRIYRGMPSATHSPKGYAAARKQVARWRQAAGPRGLRLDVQTRPLDYRTGEPREKGIDVLLALDLAFGAADNEFDVVVLFSGDSDLLPALEKSHALGVACETAVWVGGGRRQPQTDCVKWEHRLRHLDYEQVHDEFDYNR
jgi:uncharacterized LabA/DUF88 family protein